MKRFLAGTILAMSLAMPTAPAIAQDGDGTVYRQDGAWALDYGDDYCRLASTFNNGRKDVFLALERIEASPLMRVVLVGDIRMYRGAMEMGFTLLPSGSERKVPFVSSQTADGQRYVNLGPQMLAEMPAPAGPLPAAISAPPPYDRAAELAAAENVDAMLFQSGLTEAIRLETGSLRAPVEALQLCVDELLDHWGLDADRHAAMSRQAWPAEPMHSWLPGGTIPFSEFGKLGGGANQLRMMVDAEGKVTACEVHWPTLAEGLNRQICDALVTNGKFEPALDADGQPFASYFTTLPFAFTAPR